VCGEGDILRYRSRLSGPLVDRIDLHVTLSSVPLRALGGACTAEGSVRVRARVEAARTIQRARFVNADGIDCNARAPGRQFVARLSTEARALLDAAADSLALSARGYHRVAKVARTIGDLAGQRDVETTHVAEALRYRPLLPRP